MEEANEYLNMSAKKALKYANENFMLIPDIQREYVWTMSDIELLFESIADGYPVGTYILWKTSRKVINQEKPNLYYFLRDVKRSSKGNQSKNIKAPEPLGEEGDYYIVLDGQQRITSLNIALYGTFEECPKRHKTTIRDNWVTRELYYDLDYLEKRNEEDRKGGDPLARRFIFLSKEEASKGNYFKIKEIMKYDQTNDLMRDLLLRNYSKDAQDDITKIHRRITSTAHDGLVHYYCISNENYDEALDIFVRVNSTGKKLTKSDLLVSTLIDGWKGGKTSIDNLIEVLNAKDEFDFTKDYLMRLALVLTDSPTDLKITSFRKDVIDKIRDNWSRIEDAVCKTRALLKTIGLSEGFLTSYNATMPLAYYIYRGGEFKTDDSKKEVKRFMAISMAKGMFNVSSNSALSSARKALLTVDPAKTPFSVLLFKDIVLTGSRTFNVAESDIDSWLDNWEKGQGTYILLTLLYPELKLDQVTFHQDHCHPYTNFNKSSLKMIGLSDEKINEWQRMRNLLPNLQFLEGKENEIKNKTPLKDWIEQDSTHTVKYLPENVSLELKDFESFFERRRSILKSELMKIFEIS